MVDPIALGPGGEFDLIRRFLERCGAAPAEVLVGPGDDAAVLAGDGRIVVSTDLTVEGTHFRREWLDPAEIGYRAAAAALSDLAAMAASPVGVLVSLVLPDRDVPDGAVGVMDGVRQAADEVGAAILGGDVARSPGPLILDLVVLGRAERPVLRSGARPGDELWVTGTLGGAAAAVEAWLAGRAPDPEARAAFAHPTPRIREARWLAERGAIRAMLDLSDGLAGDARHLAAASGVAIVLEPGRVPVHPAAAATGAGLRLALSGGEDYELCFAAPAGAVEPLIVEFEREFGVPLHRVGEVREGAGVFALRADGTTEPLISTGFRHFDGEVG